MLGKTLQAKDKGEVKTPLVQSPRKIYVNLTHLNPLQLSLLSQVRDMGNKTWCV